VVTQIDKLGSGGNASASDGLDFSFGDDDGLILSRRSTGSIDHAHMGKRDHGSIDLYKLLNLGRKRLGYGNGTASHEDEEARSCFPHNGSWIQRRHCTARLLQLRMGS
jgi:hypothetical protein